MFFLNIFLRRFGLNLQSCGLSELTGSTSSSSTWQRRVSGWVVRTLTRRGSEPTPPCSSSNPSSRSTASTPAPPPPPPTRTPRPVWAQSRRPDQRGRGTGLHWTLHWPSLIGITGTLFDQAKTTGSCSSTYLLFWRGYIYSFGNSAVGRLLLSSVFFPFFLTKKK